MVARPKDPDQPADPVNPKKIRPAAAGPLGDPQHLREQTRRLHRILKHLSDPEVQRELAAHSLQLAQRAEAIDRAAQERMNGEWPGGTSATDAANSEAATGSGRWDMVQEALDSYQEVLEVARWYREFAERAGSPVIWEARLRMADDLEREAANGFERRLRRADSMG